MDLFRFHHHFLITYLSEYESASSLYKGQDIFLFNSYVIILQTPYFQCKGGLYVQTFNFQHSSQSTPFETCKILLFFCLKHCNSFLFHLERKHNSLKHFGRLYTVWFPITLLVYLSFHSLSLPYSSPATLAFLVCLQHTKHTAVSGHLHLLFSLPRQLFLQMPTSSTPHLLMIFV